MQLSRADSNCPRDLCAQTQGWGFLVQFFPLLSNNVSHWFLTINRQQDGHRNAATAMSLMQGLFWFKIPWVETQLYCETKVLMRSMARERPSQLHFQVLSGRAVKAEVLTNHKDPSAPSDDMAHEQPEQNWQEGPFLRQT